MHLRDERYLALLHATDRKYTLPQAEEVRREAEEIRNLRLALDDKEFGFRFGPFRRLAPWARSMRRTQHFQKWRPELRRLYNRYATIKTILWRLGGRYTRQGEIDILEGINVGWPQMRRGIEHRYWSLRIHSGLHGIVSWDDPPQICSAIAVTMALALRQWPLALFSRSVLLRLMMECSHKPDWQYSPFTAFSIRLCQLWSGTVEEQETVPTTESLGDYRGIIAQWAEGGHGLEKALWEACDFHCVTLRPRPNGEGDYELAGDAAAFPCDILAIYRIRELLGLDTPKISRPLLDSPLANPPFHIPRIEDPLLDQVARKFCAEFSQEEGPWRS